MKRPVAEFIPKDKIQALIEKGRKRSYLTIEEVLDVLPKDITDPEYVGDIVQMIEDVGVEVAK